jgi:hypothetical protein
VPTVLLRRAALAAAALTAAGLAAAGLARRFAGTANEELRGLLIRTGVTADVQHHRRNALRECAKRLNLPPVFTRVVQRAASLISRQAGGGERLQPNLPALASPARRRAGDPPGGVAKCGAARGESGQSLTGP